MMRNKGRKINHKRVERIWHEEGLKVPKKQPKRRRLWLNDGSCVRLRPEYRNHVWSYDFIEDKLTNGRKVRWLNIIDEHERVCLASVPRFKWRHSDIIEVLSGIMVTRGCPEYIRSDNGSEFTAKRLLKWFKDIEVATMFIEPGSPWENGYCESFNSIMRDNFLNGELFRYVIGSQDLDRALEGSLQHRTSAWISLWKATCTPGCHCCLTKFKPACPSSQGQGLAPRRNVPGP
jgi:transposase InsO family protein